METKKPMTEAALRRFAKAHLDAWNAHDVDACLALVTDDVLYDDPTFERPARGKKEMADRLRSVFAAFPDLHFAEDQFHVHTNVAQSECVVTYTFTGTMTGALPAPEGRMPATGKRVEVSGAALHRFDGELNSHMIVYYDSLGFMQQLGLLPESTGLGFKAVVLADLIAGKAKKALHLV